jgi:hypothetical protein
MPLYISFFILRPGNCQELGGANILITSEHERHKVMSFNIGPEMDCGYILEGTPCRLPIEDFPKSSGTKFIRVFSEQRGLNYVITVQIYGY